MGKGGSGYIKTILVCLFDGVLRHFQQYINYRGGQETGGPGENHRSVASH